MKHDNANKIVGLWKEDSDDSSEVMYIALNSDFSGSQWFDIYGCVTNFNKVQFKWILENNKLTFEGDNINKSFFISIKDEIMSFHLLDKILPFKKIH